jgi:hypothetical protein
VDAENMTLPELRAFIAAAPWRHVRDSSHGNPDSQMDPHEYVIATWRGIDREQFERFVETIARHGYRGRYRPRYSGRALIGRYLVVDEHVYWHIPPVQLARTLVEYRQHEPLEDAQMRLPERS